MEVNGLGSTYFDNLRVTSASMHNAPDFDEKFERARKQEQANNPTGSSDGYPARYSAKQPIDKTDELYGLCLELETFIVKNLLTTMRNTVQKSGLIDDSFAGQMYEDMLYDEYAKDFTKNAGLGLAEQAYRQLKSYY